MKPHELKPPRGSHKRSQRVGRGEGSGRGKTAGRGTKGTKARGEVRLGFEGGQMPLIRRVPKLKGFTPPNRKIYEGVNVRDLERVQSAVIGPDDLRAVGLVKGRKPLVKILGMGEVERKLTVRAHAFSESARSKIEGAGGSVEILDVVPDKNVRKK